MSDKNKHIRVNIVSDGEGEMRAMLPQASYMKQGTSPVIPKPIKDPDIINQGTDWVEWGRGDRFPREVEDKLKKTTTALPIVGRHVGMMYGQGVYYYRRTYNDKGIEVREKLIMPEIEDFLKMTNHPKYCQGILFDYKRFFNCFTSLMFSSDKRKIVRLVHRPAKSCRLGKPNARLEIDNIFMAHDFPSPVETVKIQAYNENDPWRSIQRLSGSRELIIHHKYNTGDQYYATPFHIGLFEKGGWLDVSINTPLTITQMQRNQVSLKYIIRIPINYFVNRYKDWHSMTQVEQQKIIDAKIDDMNNNLSGSDNIYKSITDIYGVDAFGNAEAKIEVEAVDDKTRNDQWIPSSDAADKQVAYALMMNPNQIGMGTSSSIGSGSGSDIREGFNGITDTNTIEQETALEAFKVASMVNGWDVLWAFEHTRHVTTDNAKTGIKNE